MNGNCIAEFHYFVSIMDVSVSVALAVIRTFPNAQMMQL